MSPALGFVVGLVNDDRVNENRVNYDRVERSPFDDNGIVCNIGRSTTASGSSSCCGVIPSYSGRS